MLSPAPEDEGGDEDALADRALLGRSLDQAVGLLRAAGVASRVRMSPLRDVQGQRDRMIAVLPLALREAGTSGIDRQLDAGGLYEVTEFDESTFQ